MPDTRSHRGPHPRDEKLFGSEKVPTLRAALADYCMLLTKGYAQKSSLKLVGDRFGLTERQRLAIMRAACSDEQLERRRCRCVQPAEFGDKELVIDGYNLLITIEAAMSGGLIFEGRDGCYRDLASIHGTYRRVSETIPALRLIGGFLADLNPAKVRWLLDRPVSNSGRLKTLMGRVAGENGWAWTVGLLQSPDRELARSEAVVVTSDSAVLDRCGRWANLAREMIVTEVPSARIIALGFGL